MRIGVDLGGTKIEAIALGADGETLARRRIATPQDDYRGTLEAIAALIGGIEAEIGQQGTIGIGIPGALSRASGLVKNANSTCLIGRPLDRDLEAALGRPVRIDNDANCFALSEAVDGAGAGAEVVFGVILGTGVGGGVAVAGRPLKGLNAIAGEWGHNPLPWPDARETPGPLCYCGKSGCIETFLSGPGLARDHDPQADAANRQAAIAPRAEEVVAAAEAGDARAEATLRRYEDRLARALATVINIIDPDVIVLGGGLSKLSRLYSALPQRLPSYVFSDRVDTPVVPPRHGDASGVRGAAWLWADAEHRGPRTPP